MGCWDIKGKALNVPVYELLGGRYHSQLKAYASNIILGRESHDMARDVAQTEERGFRSIKAQLGDGTLKEDLDRFKILRDTVGPDVDLMIVLNAGYDALDAYQAVQQWEEFGLTWPGELHFACNDVSLATGTIYAQV